MGIFDEIRDWFSSSEREAIKNDNGYNKTFCKYPKLKYSTRDTIEEGNKVNGIKEGVWKYNENHRGGFRKQTYEKGKTVYITLYYDNWKKVSSEGSVNTEGKELWKWSSPQGGSSLTIRNLRSKYIINDECKIGVWKHYDSLGNLTEKDYGENKSIAKEDLPKKKSNTTIISEANIGVNQKLPIWFTMMEDVKTYDNGDIVINWGGKEIELNNIELSMYHYLMGAKKILDNGMDEKVWSSYKRGIDWFRKNNPKAYMELFD